MVFPWRQVEMIEQEGGVMADDNRLSAVVTIAIGTLLVLALAALLVVTQLDKWTCAPPDGVWVEGPDHCMDLP